MGRMGLLLFIASACLLSGCMKHSSEVKNDPAALALLHKAEAHMHRASGICNLILFDPPPEAELPPAPQTVEELKALLDKTALLLKQALEIDPRLHRARLCLATVYLRGGEPRKAIGWAETYHCARPEDTEGVAILCYAYLGAEKFDALIEFCGSLLARGNTGNSKFLAQMTVMGWFCKGDMERSRAWANRVIEMNPDGTQGYHMLAMIQAVSGDEAGLEKTREVVRRLDPKAEERLDRMLDSLEKNKGDLKLMKPFDLPQ